VFGGLAHRWRFEPAEMADRHFVDTPGPQSAPGWIDGRGRVDPVVRCVGDGGLVSTVDDLLA
jgi:hypothetical protein